MPKKIILKKGDAVQFEYHNKYDREIGTGIIVNVEECNFYRVCLIGKTKGEWYWSNFEASLPINRLKILEKTIGDFGLSF